MRGVIILKGILYTFSMFDINLILTRHIKYNYIIINIVSFQESSFFVYIRCKGLVKNSNQITDFRLKILNGFYMVNTRTWTVTLFNLYT